MRRPLLSDERVELALYEREVLQYRVTNNGPGLVDVEVTGPSDSMWFRYTGRGPNKEVAIRRLRGAIAGFIGQLVEETL